MVKIRLTKNELKKQKDDLKRFTRYLPTLELKKQQLLVEIRKVQREMSELAALTRHQEEEMSAWVGVFAEKYKVDDLISISNINVGSGNIAGIDIPLFEDMQFEEAEYDLLTAPLWVDRALEVCREQIERRVKTEILKKQEEVISQELRVTIQRIKLFEEVKIPDAKEAIRKIRIFLGDLQTAEVVRGKIAKTKILKKKEKVASE